MRIDVDDPRRDDVVRLLEEHLADMYATSPAESVHALDPAALATPDLTFWTAREAGVLLGCVALKQLTEHHGELKSMRTSAVARGSGVGRRMLGHVIDAAGARGWRRLSLETGTQDFFAPARGLYRSAGFVECEPFGEYVRDPSSVFMTVALPITTTGGTAGPALGDRSG